MPSIKHSYNKIASEFARTRQAPWPEFGDFIKTVSPGDKLLDLGCGNGRLYKFLQEFQIEYTGLDLSCGLIKEAHQQFPKGNFIEGNMTNLPLADNSFDHIWAIASFHHLKTKSDRVLALREIKRVLKPNGKLVMMVWNLFQPRYFKFLRQGVWRRLVGKNKKYRDLLIPWKKSGGKEIIERYYYAFHKRELKRLLQKNGFDVTEIKFSRKGQATGKLRGYNLVLQGKNKTR